VILGIYGIIVVSLITSIIINFYTEVKNDTDDTEETDDGIEENEEQKLDAEILELRQKLELLTEKKQRITGKDKSLLKDNEGSNAE
jgi:uncharacterized membrane protein (DUF106 family)